MAHWFDEATLEGAHDAFPELPVENETLAVMLLDVAREQVLAYAADAEPTVQVTDLLHNLGVGEGAIAQVIALLDFEDSTPGVPTRYVWAQLMQAKNLWFAGKGEDGPEGFTFSPRPLSKDIQRVIRPTSGAADVF